MRASFAWIAGVAALCALSGCRSIPAQTAAAPAGPCAIALAEQAGDARIDREIAALQHDLRAQTNPMQTNAQLEKLGWSFVEKARASFDPGYYKLAEQCALCLESKTRASSAGDPNKALSSPSSIKAAALLLRGHVLHSLHRFAEAEALARELVAIRGLAFDYGLLGDVRMEQGDLKDAALAYGKMMEQRPSPQAYSRVAHLLWLRGDLEGARATMRMAAQSAGQGDPDAAAWAWTRSALFELQAGNAKRARAMCDLALEFRPDYAPAMLAKGRLLLAENRVGEALPLLRKAVDGNRLPEYLWTLADALRASGQTDEAARVETELARSGPANDPRTYALYLATRGEQAGTALRLAQEELKLRRDVYTLDALAWSQLAEGHAADAWTTMQSALAENTQDARLFLHAAVIASEAGEKRSARLYAEKAARVESLLLPGEQARLRKLTAS